MIGNEKHGPDNRSLEEICRTLTPEVAEFLIRKTRIANLSDFEPGALKPSPVQVWGVGLLFVTVISCCAAVGIGLMPLLNRRLYHRVLTFCVGLGVGSLSGSAVFHLLPQAFELVGDGTEHGYISKSWMAVVGIYLFFFVDKFLKVITEFRKQRRRNSGKAHSLKEIPGVELCDMGKTTNGSDSLTPSASAKSTALLLSKEQRQSNGQLAPVPEEAEFTLEVDTISADGATGEDAQQAHGMCSHDHDVSFQQGDSVIATVAWMIIFGDGLHNFIDGLSIGAAFSKSILTGISVSLAVLCEEFPHELGDVAILISAGMTMKQALTYNMLSACTCYLGFVIGVLLGELSNATPYIFALAGGMFLYISLASMVPEMNNASDRHLSKGLSRGLRAISLQAAGVAVGLLAMFLMAYYGSNISIG